MSKGAPQRKHDLGRVFDALKYVVRSGIVWRYLPSDFPPWAAVCQRVRGSKIHVAVDSLGHLLAAVVTPANENERRQVDELAKRVQEATGESLEVAWVDQGYTEDETKEESAEHGITLVVVKYHSAEAIVKSRELGSFSQQKEIACSSGSAGYGVVTS